jgi:hypothetical protein
LSIITIFFIIADPSGFILFPLVVHSFDLVVSSVGILSIQGTRESGIISAIEDPMAIMQKGYSITIMLAVLTFGVVSHIFCQIILFDSVVLPVVVTAAISSYSYDITPFVPKGRLQD